MEAGPSPGRLVAMLLGLTIGCGRVSGQEQRLNDVARDDLEQRPFVQFDLSGHTSAVSALAFADDSQWLVSGGLDRLAHIWLLKPHRGLGVVLSCSHADTIRWQVARADRGMVNTLALRGDLLAVAGLGASGRVGEIAVFDWRRNHLRQTLGGHAAEVMDVAFSPDGQFLASLDISGRCLLWNTSPERWTSSELCAASERIRVQLKNWLADREATLRLAWAGSDALVTARPAGKKGWQLWRYPIRGGSGQPIGPVERAPFTGIAATADGATIAGVTALGLLEVYHREKPVQRACLERLARCLAIHPSGTLAAVGTYAENSEASQLMGISLNDPITILWRVEGGDQAIRACAFSADGTKMAYDSEGGRNLVVRAVEPDRSRGQDLYQVRRPAWIPYHATLSGSTVQVATAAGSRTFDVQKLKFATGQEPPHADQNAGTEPRPTTIQLGEGLYCSVDRETNELVVHRGTGETRTELRRFRGHHDGVFSLSVSTDRKYVVSASNDGTVRWWSLAGLDKGVDYRWGARFRLVEGRVQVVDLEPAGLLFREGLRDDASLDRIWLENREQPVVDAQEIQRRLESCGWGQTIRFESGGRQFIRRPAWSELCSLLVTTTGDWVYWTPEGYYAASTEGNRLIGWQVRRGLEKSPLYFRADQVRHTLERPLVMARLLESGSLEAALQAAAPTEASNRHRLEDIANRIPQVTIETPVRALESMGRRLTIQCRIEVPDGATIAPEQIRLFANGVHGQITRIERQGAVLRLTGELVLPADSDLQIQVRAWSEAYFGEAMVRLRRDVVPDPERRAIYSFLAGADDYQHLSRLRYCLKDVDAVAQLVQAESNFDFVATPVVARNFDRKAFREAWTRFVATTATARLAPDDVVLIFVSAHGHGEGDRYYLAGVDGQFAATEGAVAGKAAEQTLIRLDELLADLARLPCRKIVLLDTCRAGTLLAAIRALQDDLVFAVVSCRAEENSVEFDQHDLGYFTYSLIQGLRGGADQDGNAAILLPEICDFVERDVPRQQVLQIGDAVQHPQCFPHEMIANTRILLAP